MRSLVGALIIVGVVGGGTWAAASDQRWIHIRVDDSDDGPEHVDIQVPITLVSSLLPMLQARTSVGAIHLDGRNVDLDNLREYWTAVRDAKDGEYITVRDSESHVRVAKNSGNLLLNVDESEGGSRVRMKIPLPLVDAVLSDGESIDLNALSKALEKAPSGDLLTVDDENSHVRIWIDNAPASSKDDKP